MKAKRNNKFLLTKAVALAAVSLASSGGVSANGVERLEEITVVAEKRSESLQDLSQAVTAMSDDDLDNKNVGSFVDLSAIAPGVTVSKNEGFKTIVSIRGLGNEANQNATANPSVSFHMDGVYIASPFAMQTDFIDVDRIEVLRGPQGTLFGQNSTGGAINVLSKKPSTEGFSGKVDASVGNHNLTKVRASVNAALSDAVATRTSISQYRHDGYSENVINGQELDQADNISARSDWVFDVSDTLSLRVFGQYFKEDTNGAAIKGIDDPTSDERELAQDTKSYYGLESQVYAAIAEWDAGFATVKTLASWQKDDIHIVRDNDRHSDQLNPEYVRSEFAPEKNTQETKTLEVNVISNEPLFGSVDWIVGAFYLDTDIDVKIREDLDKNNDGILAGYATTQPEVFFGSSEVGFVSDAEPSRESLSVYGQGTYSFRDDMRLIAGLRWTDDEVESEVSNFFASTPDKLQRDTQEVTGRVALEYDVSDSSMAYVSYTRGFKPGGSNLTYGNRVGGANVDPATPALVNSAYEDEFIDAYEVGYKSEFMDGRVRTNVAAFYYEYDDLQFQATDPDLFEGGVANITESEIMGIELEMLALIGEHWTLDLKVSALETEITDDYEALDNVLPAFGDTSLDRYNKRENIEGNELAKAPNLTADINLRYDTTLDNGSNFSGTVQYTYRGGFAQRVFDNPDVDRVDSYGIVNLTASLDLPGDQWGFDLMAMNVLDEDGVNSRMTDVFGVSATGEQYVAPRQYMARVRYSF
ncbi:MAG: TonB-dependent receptor [Cellvibrionaceae bacterium]|nr:TonB-dependent receptor [Cellvibrionaceae bacterium]|tara:strand:+ start:18503 stop:20770 length:2268 start_codon:yes stop_codon:yes gene_type:complete